ncbi:pyrroline-5-carboxylate reductase [Halopseudomonas phragmitis]|uniref:Pyrroline-5-carboxylate reductase n=2 Tax=Pseudomonadaceae TaxID=135621 RepID=A0A1V0B2Y0_9GAMM|nr:MULTISPECIES: pyrroline-5-carboxylate reductase [Pseudomonadaceae]AQZ94303.1 pyrroline-5-carboxylate reductase [Halopseudomonas phragmitis]PAU85902.1 pyrroline-5-carboxylate reductase [Pseudomonas sp. WN033]RHW21250.1 pyrroline-5-carboxylate reductase [Pseudomonas jilinensis]
MSAPTIGFIGAGNMATSLIGGMLQQNFKPARIMASDRTAEQCDKLARQFGIRATTDNAELARECDVLVLAVKPQVMQQVCRALPAERKPGQLVISIAAGISCASLAEWLGDGPLVRCMPNTPSLRRQGVSGLYANALVSDTQKQQTEDILNAVGISLWLEQESQIDAVTAVSGSGPAYFFYLMEAMIAAGQQLGLPRETAERLTLFTALGAADMAVHSDVDVAELRRRVTSPGGTTEQAINSFAADGLPAMVERAMQACARRADELSKELA